MTTFLQILAGFVIGIYLIAVVIPGIRNKYTMWKLAKVARQMKEKYKDHPETAFLLEKLAEKADDIRKKENVFTPDDEDNDQE